MPHIVLIVEDQKDAREFMVLYLNLLGYEVYEAVNGSEAVQAAGSHRPDLILMDISMPVMDGLQATKIIRKSGIGISDTPILAVTAFGEDCRSDALKAGCNEVIAKPIDFDKFESSIQKYLH